MEKYNEALSLCDNKIMSENIKNNIKKSEKNMSILLKIIGNKKLESLTKLYNLN